MLVELCEKHSGQKYLRTYWYNAAVNALPTAEQNDLADQSGLKLRLGRMTHGGQKGVDSRIVRDLIVLPRNGAVRTIFLLSGDEDVREGVVEAQELGVAVVLIGVDAPAGKKNQAETLVREADDRVILSRTECIQFMADARAAPASPPTGAQLGRTPSPALRVPATTGSSVPVAGPPQWKVSALARSDCEAFGARFATDWKSSNDEAAFTILLAGQPKLPVTIDGPLLRSASIHFGATLEEPDRRAIRAGFWATIRQE